MRTGDTPSAVQMRSDADTCVAKHEAVVEGPEDWEASGEEEDEERLKGAKALEAEAKEQLAQKQALWKREILEREPMIDMGVYTKNRCFRLYLCGKFGNTDPAS